MLPAVVPMSMGARDAACGACGARMWQQEVHEGLFFSLCCSKGKVHLPPLSAPPAELAQLMQGGTPESNKFLQHARAYNSCLQFISCGVAEDRLPPGPQQFRIHGAAYHRSGSLRPPTGAAPRYAQLYIYDINILPWQPHWEGVDQQLLERLRRLLLRCNPYCRSFRAAGDPQLQRSDDYALIFRGYRTPTEGGQPGDWLRRHQYNEPEVTEDTPLAVLFEVRHNSRAGAFRCLRGVQRYAVPATHHNSNYLHVSCLNACTCATVRWQPASTPFRFQSPVNTI